MTDRLTHEMTVAYGDVDQQERMLLSRLFKVLQDAAIAHANQFGAGTNAIAMRAETWVLSRIAADIARYPCAGEKLTVETWSTGVKGFKGYREFRVRDVRGETLVAASSLWLYMRFTTKTIVRVPRDIAAGFPTHEGPPHFPTLEEEEFVAPGPDAPATAVTLRYADFDVNEHVNNAAYLDLVQTALARRGALVHPRHIRLKFAREIPLSATEVRVPVETDTERVRFAIENDGAVYAVGEVR